VSFQIRLATNADSPEVIRVIKAVYDEYGFTWDPEGYHADLYDLEKHYAEPDRFFVAETPEGVVLGTVALEIFPTIPGEPGTTVDQGGYVRCAGTDCSLERLYVDPPARRQGVGAALSAQVRALATEQGRTNMELWSDKRFTDAHRLYERLGARVVGERICDDPDVSPEWGLLWPVETP
jgi:putative acetyltransferase